MWSPLHLRSALQIRSRPGSTTPSAPSPPVTRPKRSATRSTASRSSSPGSCWLLRSRWPWSATPPMMTGTGWPGNSRWWSRSPIRWRPRRNSLPKIHSPPMLPRTWRRWPTTWPEPVILKRPSRNWKRRRPTLSPRSTLSLWRSGPRHLVFPEPLRRRHWPPERRRRSSLPTCRPGPQTWTRNSWPSSPSVWRSWPRRRRPVIRQPPKRSKPRLTPLPRGMLVRSGRRCPTLRHRARRPQHQRRPVSPPS